jgi:hypothetical protein
MQPLVTWQTSQKQSRQNDCLSFRYAGSLEIFVLAKNVKIERRGERLHCFVDQVVSLKYKEPEINRSL